MKVNSMKYRKVIISLDLGKNGGHTNGGFGGRSIVLSIPTTVWHENLTVIKFYG